MSDMDDREALQPILPLPEGEGRGEGALIRDSDPPPVCQSIRTKMQYVTPGHSDGWERPSATAGYWCLHTMSPIGPDDEQATPRACRPGRGCYEADD